VRVHRRGLKDRISSQAEEALIADALLSALNDTGNPRHVRFENPDAVVVVEMVENRACVSTWMREDQEHHRFLRLD
jgi:tRNA(Ser,Leu) C12 N-acetylase TAN1